MKNMQTDSAPRGLALPMLRVVREHQGLSQGELATRAGMTRAAIANLEHGTSRARPSSALRLAQALRISLDVLRGNEPLPSPEGDAPDGVLTVYFNAAMRRAIYRRVGEQHIYAAIPGMPGLWARGYTHEEAEKDLREALEWWVLTAVFDHRPLPAFDGASLEITQESKESTSVLYPAAEPSAASFLDALGEDIESQRADT